MNVLESSLRVNETISRVLRCPLNAANTIVVQKDLKLNEDI